MTALDLSWQEHAACQGADPDLFFPSRGESADAAEAICFSCPVWDQCFEYGLYQRFGIWAGTSERERRRIRRQRGITLIDDTHDSDEDDPDLEETA